METLTPQQRIADRYRLDAVLESQDDITLWRGTDVLLNRPVRVRTLPASQRADAFLEAARRAAACSSPNLIPVLDAQQDGDIAFSVHGPAEGPVLEETLATGALGERAGVRTAIATLTAIQELRRCGVSHRPPIPRQIYGLGDAAVLDAIGAEPDASPAEDVREVAVTLYRSLTGRPPARRPAPPRAIDPRVGREVADVTLRALAGGIATPDAFIGALERIRTEDETVVVAPAPEPSVGRHTRGWMLIPAALLLGTALIIGAGLIIARIADPPQVLDRPTPSIPPPRGSSQPESVTMAARQMTPSAYDPYGDDVEGTAALAIDGNPSTAWETESYQDGLLGKPGVGLLLAMNDRATVTGFRMRSPIEGWSFQLRVGDDLEQLATTRGPAFDVRGPVREEIDPVDGRYVLVWITDLPETDGIASTQAAISEIQIDVHAKGKHR